MARKNTAVDEPKKPENAAPISLARAETRTERVPIAPEQVQARMTAAAGIIQEALVLEGEHAEFAARAKTKKKAAEAMHEKADRIILDAQHGTMNADYPVIVERHPTHPAEMIVWRVPDGIVADDLLAAEMPEGEERIAARQAQGCIEVETRAMSAEELEVARAEDVKRQNPELPLPGLAPADGGAPAVTEGAPAEPAAVSGGEPTGVLVDIEVDGKAHPARVEQQGDAWFCTLVEEPEVFVEAPGRDEAIAKLREDLAAILERRAQQAGARAVDVKEPKKGAVLCPYILVESKGEPTEDEVCGKPGATRTRGLCPEHYEAIGGKNGAHGSKMATIVARKVRREFLLKEAAGRANGAAVEEAPAEL